MKRFETSSSSDERRRGEIDAARVALAKRAG